MAPSGYFFACIGGRTEGPGVLLDDTFRALLSTGLTAVLRLHAASPTPPRRVGGDVPHRRSGDWLEEHNEGGSTPVSPHLRHFVLNKKSPDGGGPVEYWKPFEAYSEPYRRALQDHGVVILEPRGVREPV